ncbi:hypothetical protein EMIT0P100_90064 [Pseudomonas sp. IT-P100]
MSAWLPGVPGRVSDAPGTHGSIAMSESSQFIATSTDATGRVNEVYELISTRDWQFDLWSRHPFVQPNP